MTTSTDDPGTGTGNPETVIDVSGLRMRYGSFEAVQGIELHVRRGEVFALLGPNGAGKTTTVEILEGYRRRTGGEVTVLGQDPRHGGPSWRARIGVVLQESEPEQDLTASECLRLYAGYYPAPRNVEETLALVGLSGRAGAKASRLSGGQRRRLDVALALIGDPELLFLDEPTTGFDPSARRAAWEVISGLRALGKTVFLTTHYFDHPLHGRGRAPRRPYRGDRGRPHRRPRHPTNARRPRPAARHDQLHAAHRRHPAGASSRPASAGRTGRRPSGAHQPASARPRSAAGRLGVGARPGPARPRRAPTQPRRRLPPPHPRQLKGPDDAAPLPALSAAPPAPQQRARDPGPNARTRQGTRSRPDGAGAWTRRPPGPL